MFSRHSWRLAQAAAGVAALAIYALRLDHAAGLIVDDAWYMVLAKALAQGDGYKLISAAGGAILPAVPPGFPMLLAPVFWLGPSFPDNIAWLKGVSIVAMVATGPASYWYFVRHRKLRPSLAAILSFAVVTMPAFVFLATSTVMADCVFTLAQVVTVVWLERGARHDQSAKSVVVAGVLAAATFLIRTAGVALIVAGVAYLIKERLWMRAAVFAAVVAVCVTPWLLYAQAHQPTPEQRLAHGGAIAYSYAELLSMSHTGDPASPRVSAASLADRVVRNAVNILGRDLGAIVMPGLYRGPDESGQEVISVGGSEGTQVSGMGGARAIMAVSFAISAIILIGFAGLARSGVTVAELLVPIALAMILLVGAQSYRYVLPLAPFLLLYFWRGADATCALVVRAVWASTPRARAGRVVLLAIVGLNLIDHAIYIRIKNTTSSSEWVQLARETDEVLVWMNQNLHDTAAVASTNPGLVFLRTGRTAYAPTNLLTDWPRWQAHGVRYVVALRKVGLPAARLGYEVRFQTRRQGFWIIETAP